MKQDGSSASTRRITKLKQLETFQEIHKETDFKTTLNYVHQLDAPSCEKSTSSSFARKPSREPNRQLGTCQSLKHPTLTTNKDSLQGSNRPDRQTILH